MHYVSTGFQFKNLQIHGNPATKTKIKENYMGLRFTATKIIWLHRAMFIQKRKNLSSLENSFQKASVRKVSW